MRVTQPELYRPLLEGVQNSTSELQDLRMAISTGKRVRFPSDDPLAARRILTFKDKLSELDQFSSNLVDARQILTQELSLFEDIQETFSEARAFVIEGIRGGFDANARKTFGTKVNNMLGSTLSAANTKSLGRYVFAGGKTDTIPFDTTVDGTGKITAVNYKGDSKDIAYQIGERIDLKVNKPGSEVYIDNKVFERLISIRDAFDNNDVTALQSELKKLDKMETDIFQTIGDFGTKLDQVSLIEARHTDTKIQLEQLRSHDEDADIGEMITKLQVQETVLQAALAAGSRITRLSLVNFL